MKNFVQKGDNITVTAPAAVSSGAGVLVGDLFGIANGDAEAGETVVISTYGVFDLPKILTDGVAVGDELYWDAGNAAVTLSDTGFKVGHAVAVAGNPSATARVRLAV